MFRIGKRIFLFLILNLLILVTISITLNLLGVKPYLTANGIDYVSLMIFCLVWGMGGAFISLLLSKVMAKWMMGVEVISPDTRDAELSWLVNTVYRLARQAGLSKMPEVGIYDSPEINAFATGPTRNNALVAVSAGLLRAMEKDEIEGVLGHEITHISNGDMVTMTLLQGVINAIVMFLARVLSFFIVRKRDSEDDSPFLRFMVTMILEILLSFLGMIVIAAFSRYREYKADHGGAQLAGREKMIAALEKLSKTIRYADISRNESIAAFKISSNNKFFKLFATHPPLEDRIARLRGEI
jgi:heat shock protein HtpX